MDIKEWRKEMGQKFLNWRQENNYTGTISTPEVAHWTMDIINEIKTNDILPNKSD